MEFLVFGFSRLLVILGVSFQVSWDFGFSGVWFCAFTLTGFRIYCFMDVILRVTCAGMFAGGLV